MERLAEEGSTADPLLAALLQARRLNAISNGVVVQPWQILEEPDYYEPWILAADELERLPAIVKARQARKKAIDDVFAKARAAHPNYNKYRH